MRCGCIVPDRPRHLIAVSCALVLFAGIVQAADVDPFMGDWQGDWEVVDAVVTVVQNGMVIHDQLAMPHPTGGAPDDKVAEPGPMYLQDDGNLVQFRKIWLVEQK